VYAPRPAPPPASARSRASRSLVKPRTVAVLRLMTSSNLVGLLRGKVGGLGALEYRSKMSRLLRGEQRCGGRLLGRFGCPAARFHAPAVQIALSFGVHAGAGCDCH